MGFSFSYRTPYQLTCGRYIKHFPDHTILSWFQENWRCREAFQDELSVQLLGIDAYGFASVFERIIEHNIPLPKNNKELKLVLDKHVYAEGGHLFKPQLFEVFTDDDELDLQYYFVDDRFAEKYADRCRFLLHDGSLPTKVNPALKNAATATQNSDACTWLYVFGPIQSADSQTWDRVICPGVRLKHSAAVIEAYEQLHYQEAEGYFEELQAIGDQDLPWSKLFAKLLKSKEPLIGDNDSKLICKPHIYQLHHHVRTNTWHDGRLIKRFN